MPFLFSVRIINSRLFRCIIFDQPNKLLFLLLVCWVEYYLQWKSRNGGGNKTDKQMHKLSTDKWVRFYTLRERSEVKWMVGRNDYEIFFVSSSGITKNYYKEDIFVRRLLWVERTEDQKEGGLKSQ